MRRPTVLFINRVYPPGRGATGRLLRDLARSFAREGWQVTVVATGPKAERQKDGAIRVLRVKGRQRPTHVIGFAWLWLKLLVAALRLPRTDLVVTLTDPPMLVTAGQIVKRFKKNRHINWCQDLYPDLFPALEIGMPRFVYRFLKKRARNAMNNADRTITVGRCMAKSITALGIDPKKVSFIPNWPDFELSRPPRAPIEGEAEPVVSDVLGAKPHEEQIKDEPKFRVLYAGNIGRAHPVDVIIEAAAILDEQNPEIEFVFVGDGPRFDYIARQRVHRGLGNIRLMPFQPQSRLREVMESGDIHLITVKDEAAGLLAPCKLYSALAVARPCIYVGPENTEIAKVITDFNAGMVIPQGRPEELAEAILRYRMDSAHWFAGHEGAMAAGKIFLPREAIEAWMQRAWSVVEPDMKEAA